ncbi:aspartate aminotransferase family protein [Ammoniphilus resinae]|uniref:Adenosylmethionine-8-amino-7-oxononanoate aminotransferase n=1 Tax=Ammoniphilus resinae TaxID=861532 RepID=A0ABS4GMB2_9BACL|nr:aspartate aminotransferase family protein [Ammoniphilus resinae]MBP1931408.1 adenosylmethionine-8-amino-7-oxononanoate aminotransferase [Ammoniphilus resinae]
MTISEEYIKYLRELDKKHYLHPTSSIRQQQENGPAFIFTDGEGVYLKDISGKTLIDGMSSLWNVNVGHGREELGQVALEQMKKLGYSSSFATFSHEPAILLAAKIAEMTPGDLNAIFYTSGGSESNDTAFKIVRHYWNLKGQPEKKKIISRKRGYHGVAMGATSATGIPVFHAMSGGLLPDFLHVDAFSTQSLRDMIEAEGADTIAAFIAEPIQGAGGVHIPQDPHYFQRVREICDEYNILFIADEVITGFGRTGKMFAMEHWGVVPDLMSIAKGITSGYAQLGGVVISEKIHSELINLSKDTFFHGFTYSGHPVACAVALRNIEIIESENLVENSRVMGQEMLKGFQWLQQEIDIVGEVRGLGLVGAIEIVKDKATGERFESPLSPKIVAEAANRGLICRCVTFEGSDTLVFAPPLVINKEEINKMIHILHETFVATQVKN